MGPDADVGGKRGTEKQRRVTSSEVRCGGLPRIHTSILSGSLSRARLPARLGKRGVLSSLENDNPSPSRATVPGCGDYATGKFRSRPPTLRCSNQREFRNDRSSLTDHRIHDAVFHRWGLLIKSSCPLPPPRATSRAYVLPPFTVFSRNRVDGLVAFYSARTNASYPRGSRLAIYFLPKALSGILATRSPRG